MKIFAKARYRPRIPGRMNKLEATYAHLLDSAKRSHVILEWSFEAVKLRLADRTWYTPDFMVINADGIVEFHEVKGFWEDDARVKIKVAAETFPFAFKAKSCKKGVWKTEEF